MFETLVPAQFGIGQFVQSLLVGALRFVVQVATFVATLLLVVVVGRLAVEPLVENVLDRRDVEPTLRKPAVKALRVVVVFVGLVVALALGGFGGVLTAMATLAAALTLAVGFAAQDVIGNLVAGVFLIADPKIRIGDWIEWDDQAGIIEDVSLRVSRVRTFDNELVTVPNSDLANAAITNPVAKERLRVQFPFGIGYEDDIDEATAIIEAEAAAHDDILDDPATSVRLADLGASSVVLVSRFWIDDPSRSDSVRVRSEYVQAVKERFDAEGIDMPYDYRQLTGEIDVDGLSDGDVADALDGA